MRPRIVDAMIHGRNGQVPSIPSLGPLRPHETKEMDDGIEESWHNANKRGCEMSGEEVEEGTRKQPDRGPNLAPFRIGWGVIRLSFVQPTVERAALFYMKRKIGRDKGRE